jgi:hypothetical protein
MISFPSPAPPSRFHDSAYWLRETDKTQVTMAIEDKLVLTHISNLNSTNEPLGVRRHLCLCGFECGEDALEVHTRWVRNKISPFSSLSTRL